MRILLLFAGFLFFISAQAQVQLGVQAGVNSIRWSSANARPGASGETYSTSATMNLQGGVVGVVDLAGAWQLRPGVFLTGKGTTLSHQSSRDTSSLDIWLRYVELPVVLVYQGHLGGTTGGFAGAGLYGAFGLYGAALGEGIDQGSGSYHMESEVEFSRRNETRVFPPVVSPFDYGYTFLAGLERRKVQLLLTYTRGLKTIVNPELFYGSYKNRVLSLSLAYMIHSKRKQALLH